MELQCNSDGGGSTTTSEASIYKNIPLTVVEFFTKSSINDNGITSFYSPNIRDCKSSSSLSSKCLPTDYLGDIK